MLGRQSSASNSRTTGLASRRPSTENSLLRRVAQMDEEALGDLVDRWSGPLYGFADAFRMTSAEADESIEELFRRLMFEAPGMVARHVDLTPWIRENFRDCAGAVLGRRLAAAEFAVPSAARPVGTPVRPDSVAKLEDLLTREGISAALAYLNSLTPFRFTGVYRFDGLNVISLYLYDRTVGGNTPEAVARATNTYCLWIHEALSVVQMSDSLTDPRADTHPKREAVRSYCGGPIRDSAGGLFGTVCHFDYEPRLIPRDAMSILADVGPLIGRALVA